MEYDSKNVLHFLHLNGASQDIYQGFLKHAFLFYYFVRLIAYFAQTSSRVGKGDEDKEE